jgi:hypothetical protein
MLARSVPAPIAVLNAPMVLLLSDKNPTAVLKPPVVRLKRAVCPSAGVPPGIASVGRRNYRLHSWEKRKADKHEHGEK